MKYNFRGMLTNGEMAREIGVDPKTLRAWAVKGYVPSTVNPANGYRYYIKSEIFRALMLDNPISSGTSLDDRRKDS